MNENEMMQDDEISLFDLWEKLRDGWRYVVGRYGAWVGRRRRGADGFAAQVRGGGGSAGRSIGSPGKEIQGAQ